MMLTKEQRDYLLPQAYNAAVRAGAAILRIYKLSLAESDVALKSDNTPITGADREAHRIIRDYLSPSHVPMMSEEGREMIYEERRGWELFWLVDPLDGTKEFLKRNGEFTVNIALVAQQRPVMGVVYVPYLRKMYFTYDDYSYVKSEVEPDEDASLTMEEILSGARRLPVKAELNNPIKITISRSHNTDETFKHIDTIKRAYPDAEVVEHGSSYKFCMLAEGDVDIYVRTTNTYEWDTAAGEAILEKVGGITKSLLDGAEFKYNEESLKNPYFIAHSRAMREHG